MKILAQIQKMIGATAAAAGRAGYLPKPAAGDHIKTLFGDGSYKAVDGMMNILWFGGDAGGVADNTAALAAAKTAGGANAIIYFPGNSGTTYYFSGTTDLTGATLVTDPGVTLSINNTTGVEYRAVKAGTDIRLTVRAKSKTYTLTCNQTERSLFRRNASRSSYTSGAALSFSTDFTTGEMAFNAATPGAPAVAPTLTANKYQIDTQTVAATTYLGPWRRPKVGQTVQMACYTFAAQSSGNVQAVMLDSTGTEYCGIEIIDFSNGLKSLTYEVNVVRMSGGTRSRISRLAVRDKTWMGGHNGTAAQTVILGIKMVAPGEAEFYVNGQMLARLTFNSGNNADRIFFGFNGAYSGAASGFYDPVAYEDKNISQSRRIKIAYFGDSLTWGSSTVLPWPQLVPLFLEGGEGIGYINSTDADNYAYTGHTSAQQLTAMGSVTLANYNVVCICVGINDCIQAVSYDDYATNLTAMITAAQAAGCAVVVGLFPMFATGGNDVRGGLMRARCQRVALSMGCRVADPLEIIGDRIDDLYVGDLVHPAPQGQVYLAQAFAREIAKLYAQDQPTLLNKVRRVNGQLRTQGTAAPTTGYFLQGDKVENSAPADGAALGWVCTTAGAPGTWQKFGMVGSNWSISGNLTVGAATVDTSHTLVVKAGASALGFFGRSDSTSDGAGQALKVLGGSNGGQGSAILLDHLSYLSGVLTRRNYINLYDTGVSIHDGSGNQIFNVNTASDRVTFNASVVGVATITYAATTNIDCSGRDLQTVTLTGNVTFTSSNMVAGKRLRVRIIGNGGTVAWPAWNVIGPALPGTIANGKIGHLDLTCWGGLVGNVDAHFEVQA